MRLNGGWNIKNTINDQKYVTFVYEIYADVSFVHENRIYAESRMQPHRAGHLWHGLRTFNNIKRLISCPDSERDDDAVGFKTMKPVLAPWIFL